MKISWYKLSPSLFNQKTVTYIVMSQQATLAMQKAQTVIGIANLAKNQQIHSSIKEVQKSQAEATKIMEESNEINRLIADIQARQLAASLDTYELKKMDMELQQAERKRIQIKEEKEAAMAKDLMAKREVIFQAHTELDRILSSKQRRLEKFYRFNAIIFVLAGTNINSEDFTSFEDKKYFKDTNETLFSSIDKAYENLTDDMKDDVTTINAILSIVEEDQIEVLTSLMNARSTYRKSLEKRIETVTKAKELEVVKGIKAE